MAYQNEKAGLALPGNKKDCLQGIISKDQIQAISEIDGDLAAYLEEHENPEERARALAAGILNNPAVAELMADKDPWGGEPMPWPAETEDPPFPIDSLPEELREAVVAVASLAQLPPDCAAPFVLAACSAAAATVADVCFEYPGHSVTWPTSEYYVLLARSGARKSAVEKFISEAFKQHADELKASMRSEIAEGLARRSEWEATRESLKHQQKEAVKKRDRQTLDDIRREIVDHDQSEPLAPFIPDPLFGDDFTRERLLRDLAAWPFMFCLSAEAGGALAGYSMSPGERSKTVTALCSAFDGQNKGSRRAGPDGNVPAGNCRLTMAFAMQPHAWDDFLSNHGDLANGIGLLPRMLVSRPPDGVGSCTYDRPISGAKDIVGQFQQRIQSILAKAANKPMRNQDGGASLHMPFVCFAPDAANRLHTFMRDEIEPRTRPSGDLADFTGQARRTTEHAGRIAAAIQIFLDDNDSRIGIAATEAGIAIASYYLKEAVRLSAPVRPEIRDAQRLEAWLVERGGRASTREALQYGPGPIRSRDKLNSAIDELVEHGRGREIREGKKRFIEVRHAATLATSATLCSDYRPTVATVATVASNAQEKGGELGEP